MDYDLRRLPDPPDCARTWRSCPAPNYWARRGEALDGVGGPTLTGRRAWHGWINNYLANVHRRSLVPLVVVAATSLASCSDSGSSAPTPIQTSTSSVSTTQQEPPFPAVISGTVAITGGVGDGVSRQGDQIGGPCGAMPEPAELRMLTTGQVSVYDREGVLIGDGVIGESSLDAVVYRADGSLDFQTCNVEVEITMYEVPADLNTVELLYDGRAVPFETRIAGDELAAGFSLVLAL